MGVLNMKCFPQNSPGYKLTGIILDIATYRLFRHVRSDSTENPNRNFIKIEFRNRGLDAINISNILNHNDAKASCSTSLQESESSPIVVQLYNKIVINKDVLQRLHPCLQL